MAVSVLKLSRPKRYSLRIHRVVTKVLTVSVLDIGQHRPWSTGQYVVAIAGHYSRTINYMFFMFGKKSDNEQLMITNC